MISGTILVILILNIGYDSTEGLEVNMPSNEVGLLIVDVPAHGIWTFVQSLNSTDSESPELCSPRTFKADLRKTASLRLLNAKHSLNCTNCVSENGRASAVECINENVLKPGLEPKWSCKGHFPAVFYKLTTPSVTCNSSSISQNCSDLLTCKMEYVSEFNASKLYDLIFILCSIIVLVILLMICLSKAQEEPSEHERRFADRPPTYDQAIKGMEPNPLPIDSVMSVTHL